jgi:NAD(P)-dependent dehydrogenase (short-subunit alcohol dehydrogenase family)
MSKPITALIVGANRGLGLQLVKDALSELNASKVFATYRSEDQSKELLELAASNPNVVPIQLDIRDETKYPDVVKRVEEVTQGAGLNLLVNNAGIYTMRPQNLESITKEAMLLHFEVNTIAPLMLAKAFLPLLEKAANSSSGPLGIQRAAVVNVTSLMGSIADNGSGGEYAYRSSKTALNMVTKSLSLDLRSKNILAMVIHPGWVKTDMGGSNAPLSIEDSVRGMIKVIANLSDGDSGKFLRYNGEELPW